jgi:hypothetical protein
MTFFNNFLYHSLEISLIKIGVKGKTFFILFNVQGRGFSTVFHLLWIDDWVACFSPGLHTSTEAFYIRVAQGDVLRCLPGSGRFLVSATIKDNFLVFRKRGKF